MAKHGLPDSPFDVVAVDLQCAAWMQAHANEAMEIAVAKEGEPSFARVLTDARRTAATIGELHGLFRKVAPFEAEFRETVEDFLGTRGLA